MQVPVSSERNASQLAFGGAPPAAEGVPAERVQLRDGTVVTLRPLSTGDEAAISSWFAALGAETRYARFLGWMERLDRRTRSELARVDHIDREAIAAFGADSATAGIARYIRTSDRRTAEVAIAVADAWRGKGLARLLLERLVVRARQAGIERLTATCLATNNAVIHVLSRLGPTIIGPPEAGVVELTISLTGSPSQRAGA